MATDLTSLPDDELVDRAQAGELEAFVALWRRYEGRFWAVALRRLGNAADAEEAYCDARLKALQGVGRLKRAESFAAWAAEAARQIVR